MQDQIPLATLIVSIVSLILSILALGMSIYFWRRQFRPIITLAVRTANGGNIAIAYHLQVKNSGSIPARNINLKIKEINLEEALGDDASLDNKKRWIESINSNVINILQNGDSIACSFGTSQANNQGFWKYGAMIEFEIKYSGWFGKKYFEKQIVKIQDSDSFTGYSWGKNA